MPDPRRTAAVLRMLCETLPGLEWGCVGPGNALRLIAQAFSASSWGAEGAGRAPDAMRARAAVNEFGVKLAFFALGDYPLDPGLLALCASLAGGGRGGFMGRFASSLNRLRGGQEVGAGPLPAEDFERMRADASAGFKSGSALLRLGQAFEWCLRHDAADGGRLEDILSRFPPLPERDVDAALRGRLRAGFALARLEADEALRALDSIELAGFEAWRDLRRADCLARLGRQDEAAELLRPLWLNMPWHPNLILALHMLRFGRAGTGPPEGADLPPILLYSWNKRDVLAATLRSLLQTEAAGAPVFALDNGSADGTADMLRAMGENFRGGLTVISLPVNIGAPPARNWLLALPQLRGVERAVFLDDDLILAPGWLNALLDAARANPAAGNIGCVVTDHLPPHTVQAADFFALPPQMGQRSFSDLEENIFVHCSGAGARENLLLRYARPCLSVSGCCHMIRLDTIRDCGAFDIRFNPSQFDDLERDLRLARRRIPVICSGVSPARHVQHSSLRQAEDRAASARVFGNKIKLEFLYAQAQVEEMRDFTLKAARMDLLRKCTQLAASFAGMQGSRI